MHKEQKEINLKNDLENDLKLKNSNQVKIKIINDFVTAYFFLDKVLKNVFNKSPQEITSITENCEAEGSCEVCRVSQKKSEQLLLEVEQLKTKYLNLDKDQRMKYGTPPYLDGNIKNLTFEVEEL